MPAAFLEIMRQRLEQRRADALVASHGPLSADDRRTLEEELLRTREQHEAARGRIKAITARLTGQAPRKPAARAS
jgi:hypothetical protein